MSAVRLIVGAGLRARWRSAVWFGLVAAIGAAAVIACLAGARRSETAFMRFRDGYGMAM